MIITGCAHPGIVDIVERSKKICGQEISLVVGGFHLGDLKMEEIRKIVDLFKELNVKQVSPSHCSGQLCREQFKEIYKDDCILAGAGSLINTK